MESTRWRSAPTAQPWPAAAGDKSVRLWDVASHRQLGSPLTGHTDAVNSVAFSPDGTTLASGSDDKSVRLWDVASHRQVGSPLTGHTDGVYSVAFSPDGKTLASGGSGTDNVGAAVGCGHPPSDRLPAHRPHRCRQLGGVQPRRHKPWPAAAATRRCGCGMWPATVRSAPPLTGHTDAVLSVAFSPDGTTLASGSGDKTVRLWDVATHRQIGSPSPATPIAVSSVAFSPDGTTLATGSWRQVGAAVGCGHPPADRLPAHRPHRCRLPRWRSAPTAQPWPAAAATSRCGCGMWPPTVRSAPHSPATPMPSPRWRSARTAKPWPAAAGDKSVRLWDVATHRQIGSPLTGHTDGVYSVAFSPDGKTLASGSRDKSVRLWDVASHRQIGLPTHRPHRWRATRWRSAPTARPWPAAAGDKTVRLWDVASHRPIGSPLTGHTDAVSSVAFSPDGKTLASGSGDNSVRLWDVATHRQIGSPLTGHTDAVNEVAFSPDRQNPGHR